jgi:hypothetical protein
MPKIKKKVKKNLGMILELPYQCPEEPSLKFYTTLACDAKREVDPKKVSKLSSRRCERCMGPVFVNTKTSR